MSVASLVLGIIGICFSFIPIINYLVMIPVIVGLILGIVDVAKKSKKKEEKKGMGVTGIILNSISIFIIIVISVILLFSVYLYNNTTNTMIDRAKELSYNLTEAEKAEKEMIDELYNKYGF